MTAADVKAMLTDRSPGAISKHTRKMAQKAEKPRFPAFMPHTAALADPDFFNLVIDVASPAAESRGLSLVNIAGDGSPIFGPMQPILAGESRFGALAFNLLGKK